MNKELQNLEFLLVKAEKWASFRPEIAQQGERQFLRAQGSKHIYEKKEDSYICTKCNTEILGARVAHAIHDGPFPMSGSGRCHYETVPYCPKCEEKPNFHGSPVKEDPSFF